MAKWSLLSLRRGLLVVLIFLMECMPTPHTHDTAILCSHLPRSPASRLPPLTWIDSLIRRWTLAGNGTLMMNETWFQHTHKSERQFNEAKYQGRNPQSICQCRMFDEIKHGRSKPRLCRSLLEISSPFISHAACDCCSSPLPYFEASNYIGRRCRKLQSASWTVDSTPNAKGQARRNQLRYPDLCKDLAGRSPNNFLGSGGNGWVQDLLLMVESQRQEGQGRGKGSVLIHVLVSLLAAYLLFLGDHQEQKTTSDTSECLLSLLLRPGFVHGNERLNEAIKIIKSCTSAPFFSTGKASKLFPHSHKSFHGQDIPQSKSSFQRSLEWCFNTRWFTPLHRLWVAPATSFLPSASTNDAAHMDHVGYRLASLASLPSSCTLSRSRLAEAGFHYNPSVDSAAVICHKCPAVFSLDQPSSGSSLLDFHLAASPSCPVARSARDRNSQTTAASASISMPGWSDPSAVSGDLGEDCEGRGPETRRDGGGPRTFLQRSPSFSSGAGYVLALPGSAIDQRNEPKTLVTQGTTAPITTSGHSSAFSQFQNDSSRRGEASPSLSEAVYPQFSTTESRLVTFHTWPAASAALFPPARLVSLGFYYAGYADCVRCFYCGVGLKSWDPQDDPLTEHVRWRPTCGYLRAIKGRECIDRIHRQIILEGAQEVEVDQVGSRRQDAPVVPQGSGSVRASEPANPVVQQLLTMGFPSQDIDSARARLRHSGAPEDLDRLLEVLLS